MSSRPGSPALPRPPRTIRRTLVHIVLACVLPAWLGIAVLIFGMYKVLGDRTPEGALMTAHALALAVDRELAIAQTALEALAGSEALSSGDLEGFREHALRDATTLEFNSVVLSRGRRPADRQHAAAARRQAAGQHERGRRRNRAQDGQAADREHVRGGGDGNAAGQHQGAGDPRRRGEPCADGHHTPERLNILLKHQKLPPDWVGAVFDATQTIVARTHNPEQYVGQHACPILGETMTKESSGII